MANLRSNKLPSPKHAGAVLLGSRGGRPKNAEQAMARAQPKKASPTGVVPHSGRKVKATYDEPNKNTMPTKSRKKVARGHDNDKAIQPTNQKTNPYGTSN